MPEKTNESTPTKHHAKAIEIRIAPDAASGRVNDKEIKNLSNHLFELPVATTVKHVKIEKHPGTGEVSIRLSE